MFYFLEKAAEERRQVTVITTNGFQMTGKIIRIDLEFRAIILNTIDGERLIFMNAISTII